MSSTKSQYVPKHGELVQADERIGIVIGEPAGPYVDVVIGLGNLTSMCHINDIKPIDNGRWNFAMIIDAYAEQRDAAIAERKARRKHRVNR